MQNFIGFPKEMISFLSELKFINTITGLEANKIRYKQLITAPLTALYQDLAPVARSVSDQLETKPARCISSMYTDRRFSPQAPLKEYLYLRFRMAGREENVPGFYFDMGTDYFAYGIRWYNLTSKAMTALRDSIRKRPEPLERALLAAEKQEFLLMGERYKKDHVPDMKDCMVKAVLNHRYFYIGRKEPVSGVINTPELSKKLRSAFLILGDLMNLLNQYGL